MYIYVKTYGSYEFFFFFNLTADGEKQSFGSPHFHVFSYAWCVDLTQLLSQPNASWRTLSAMNSSDLGLP